MMFDFWFVAGASDFMGQCPQSFWLAKVDSYKNCGLKGHGAPCPKALTGEACRLAQKYKVFCLRFCDSAAVPGS